MHIKICTASIDQAYLVSMYSLARVSRILDRVSRILARVSRLLACAKVKTGDVVLFPLLIV